MLVEFSSKKRIRVEINGIVQGVGFRPFVYQLALENSLYGFVYNSSGGVVIELEGESVALEQFLERLKTTPPKLSRIDTFTQRSLPTQGSSSFKILESSDTDATTMLLADMAMCQECREELQDPNNRRYRYPFINCTNCGPRYTLVKALPYDRERSSMAKFTMCEACKREYEEPSSRRFHTQAISCPECGLSLSLIKPIENKAREPSRLIAELAQSIRQGVIVALKGVGGFHLLCDARDHNAVARLRSKKKRPSKPFAVMFGSIAAIKKSCLLSKKEEALLSSKERPILLLQKRADIDIAEGVAPNIGLLGAFLPYTPLHELLLEELKFPILLTSANLSGAPIITDERELSLKLPNVAKSILTNDREILNSCDDSVVMCIEAQSIMLRLSRGYAPKSLFSEKIRGRKILALGANQKNTISLAFENYIILSPYIGELNSLDSYEHFLKTLKSFQKFYNFKPDIVVCDKHPDYETTKWARAYKQEHSEIELLEVQHHYAHALATMAEYNLEEEALAFCFDGTGYGEGDPSRALWGGEVLSVTPKSYQSLYHLETFSLLGGEKAVREPRRVALALLFESFSLEDILEMKSALIDSFSTREIKSYYIMYQKGIQAPRSSSIGRLFDAIYALSGHLEEISYEGESGLMLEKDAQNFQSEKSYSFSIDNGVIEFCSMLKEILDEREPQYIAAKFINTLVEIILLISKEHLELPIILSGGVFQNRTLLEKVVVALEREKRRYYIQSQTPINDGGISLGQVYYALNKNF